MAKLLVQDSNGPREFELVDVEVNLGRELDNAIRLPDPSVSRHHAVVRQANGGHEIQDLGSSNGVLVNGNRVERAQLQDGDRITLGQLQLTYVKPPARELPGGTVRMNLEDMAKLQALTTAEIPGPARPAAPVEAALPEAAPVPVPMEPTPAAPPTPPRRTAPARPAPNPAPAPKATGLAALFQWFGNLFHRS